MVFLQQLNPMTAAILITSGLVIVLVLFSKFIKGMLKLLIIAAMLLCILYILRRDGII